VVTLNSLPVFGEEEKEELLVIPEPPKPVVTKVLPVITTKSLPVKQEVEKKEVKKEAQKEVSVTNIPSVTTKSEDKNLSPVVTENTRLPCDLPPTEVRPKLPNTGNTSITLPIIYSQTLYSMESAISIFPS
jgi:hypothetical protein